jgi:Helix-turn-helix domain
MHKDYYDTTEAARYLGFLPNTLEKWRVKGVGPPFCQPNGRLVRYRKRDLDTFMAESLRTSTSDEPRTR